MEAIAGLGTRLITQVQIEFVLDGRPDRRDGDAIDLPSELLIKPSEWAGSAPAPTRPDRSWERHPAEAGGQAIQESRPDGAPAPTLPADPRPAISETYR